MTTTDFATTLQVSHSPAEVFDAINDVCAWWSEDMEGHTEKLNDIFTVHFGDTWIEMRVAELVPCRRILWYVTDCNKHWLKDPKEWKGTRISWELSADQNGTRLDFTHIGLVPQMECYNGCEKAWGSYLKDGLLKLLAEGRLA